MDLQSKTNGLSGETKIWQKQEGQHFIQYHEHPETHELVVIDSWYISDGQDDVSEEFNVIAVESPTICEISKRIALIEKKIKNL